MVGHLYSSSGVIGYPPVLWHFKAPLGSLSQHLTRSGAPLKGRLGAQRIHSSASGLFVCVSVNVCVEKQAEESVFKHFGQRSACSPADDRCWVPGGI